jgi:hypothetical protein
MLNMQKMKAKVTHENALQRVLNKSKVVVPKYQEPLQRPVPPQFNRVQSSQVSTRSKGAANFKVPQTVMEIKQLYDQKKKMANSQSTSISGDVGSGVKKKHHF